MMDKKKGFYPQPMQGQRAVYWEWIAIFFGQTKNSLYFVTDLTDSHLPHLHPSKLMNAHWTWNSSRNNRSGGEKTK